MGLFGKRTEGGMADVIRCDESDYMIWKWRPSGKANSTNKENAIRWGSSLRVKDGEVAIFVYKQDGGPLQDYIEGPFDAAIKTDNFPVISKIVGLAYAGKSPFQAEVYFINLAGNVKVMFGVPYFSVADPRVEDLKARMAARGSIIFKITDYKAFIKAHRLINFELEQFRQLIREKVNSLVKGVITTVPTDFGIPVLQIEQKLPQINELITPKVKQAFEDIFKVDLVSFDLDTLEVDETTEEYAELAAIRRTKIASQTDTVKAQTNINIRNLEDSQAINASNLGESLRIQREEAQRFQKLQTETQHISAHQINLQAQVLTAAAENLGSMGVMGGVNAAGGGTGGFNPAGVVAGMAIGGAMGGQMANMMNSVGQNMQQPMMTPPPVPHIAYNVAINGQTLGPFNLNQLLQMVTNGQVSRMTYVWKAGMANWAMAGDVAELSGLFAAPSPPPPPPPPAPPLSL